MPVLGLDADIHPRFVLVCVSFFVYDRRSLRSFADPEAATYRTSHAKTLIMDAGMVRVQTTTAARAHGALALRFVWLRVRSTLFDGVRVWLRPQQPRSLTKPLPYSHPDPLYDMVKRSRSAYNGKWIWRPWLLLSSLLTVSTFSHSQMNHCPIIQRCRWVLLRH